MLVRFVALSLLCCVLAGCSRPFPWQPNTGTLSREQVRASWEAQQNVWRLATPDAQGRARWFTPQAYVAAGYLRTRELCGNFFDQIARARQNSDFLRREIGVIGAATAGLLAAAQASATAIAVTAIGFGVADASLANTQELLLFAPVSEQARRLAFEALAVVENTAPPAAFGNDEIREPSPAERYAAEQAVRSHAEQCTLPALLQFMTDALSQVRAAAPEPLSAIELTGIRAAAARSDIRVGSHDAAAELLAGLRTPMFGEAQQRRLNAAFPGFTARLRTNAGALTPAGRDLLTILEGAATRSAAFAQLARQAEARLQDGGQTNTPTDRQQPSPGQGAPPPTVAPTVVIVPAHR